MFSNCVKISHLPLLEPSLIASVMNTFNNNVIMVLYSSVTSSSTVRLCVAVYPHPFIIIVRLCVAVHHSYAVAHN